MTRDKMGECESASRHPRMATRLSNEQNGAETERERTTSWFDLQGEDVVKVVNLKKIIVPYHWTKIWVQKLYNFHKK